VCATVLPPLVINTTLGFLLFTSHSFFALSLARLPFFQKQRPGGTANPPLDFEPNTTETEKSITLESLLQGPKVIPRHPTLLSALAGAGAGIVQGIAFTPIENVVR
jgi:hypothetical protein